MNAVLCLFLLIAAAILSSVRTANAFSVVEPAAVARSLSRLPSDGRSASPSIHSSTSNSLQRMSPLSTDNLNRGDSYKTGNSTILSATEAAAAVGVKPPAEVPASHWKRAWLILKYATPLLHLLDRQKPPNASLNLYCLWWKALSGNDPESPVFDDRLSFDILPRGTRWIVAPSLQRLFPRLHHANVEIRTAFLDRAVTRTAQEQPVGTQIRLVSLGAGYDVRSIKLNERGVIHTAYELDLPQVVTAKRRILESNRFKTRRPHLRPDVLPVGVPVDLNDLPAVQVALNELLSSRGKEEEQWFTVFLFEAVMIYLEEGVPRALLQACSDALKNNHCRGALVWADRLENVPGGDALVAREELASVGWDVVEWLPKPGLARHMGRARLL